MLGDSNEAENLSSLEHENIDFGLVDVIKAGLMGLLFSINLKVCFLIIPNFIENHVGYFLMNFLDYFGYFNH
jgi:hypothetical protein